MTRGRSPGPVPGNGHGAHPHAAGPRPGKDEMSITERGHPPHDTAPPPTEAENDTGKAPGNRTPEKPLSPVAALVVAVGTALCVATALIHLGMVFLHVAPSNAVSQRYQQRLNAWIYPYFEQNWQLFAPNPQSNLEDVQARPATRAPGGPLRAGAWLDLTAQDVAAVRHDPFPSHTAQNMLRRAWDLYSSVQGSGDQPGSERARMYQRYLTGIAARRLAAHGAHRIDAVQLRVVTTPIAPPDARAARGTPLRMPSSTRYLPWWQVTPHDD